MFSVRGSDNERHLRVANLGKGRVVELHWTMWYCDFQWWISSSTSWTGRSGIVQDKRITSFKKSHQALARQFIPLLRGGIRGLLWGASVVDLEKVGLKPETKNTCFQNKSCAFPPNPVYFILLSTITTIYYQSNQLQRDFHQMVGEYILLRSNTRLPRSHWPICQQPLANMLGNIHVPFAR